MSRLLTVILVAAMLLYSMPMIMPAVRGTDLSHVASSFWVEPETENFTTASAAYGTEFTVTVYGAVPSTGNDPAAGGYSWSVMLGYNASQLEVEGASWTNESGSCSHLMGHHGVNPPDSGLPDLVITTILDTSTSGVVWATESLTSDQYIPAGSNDTLFTVTFKIIAVPPTGGSLTCNIDPAAGDASQETYWEDTSQVYYFYNSGLSEAYCAYTYQFVIPIVYVPPGVNVTVSPTTGVGLTFANVSGAGSVTANETPTVRAPPLAGLVGQYYDINVTASYSGNVTVSLAFDGSNMTDPQKSSLRMMEYTSLPGDVNADGKVDMKDVSYVARRFGCKPGSGMWDPNADVNGDGKIDMKDISYVARRFGTTSQWTDITMHVDTVNNVIYGETTHFSLIGIH